MPCENRVVNLAQATGKLLRHANRAVLAARAPKGHGEVGAVYAFVFRHPAFEKTEDVFQHAAQAVLMQGFGRDVV